MSGKAVCIIGRPVVHSRSPLIHNYWIKRHGIDAEYRREDVVPEALADFLKNLRERGYIGANVTVPHKEAALALTTPDERARAVGAANTLWYDDGALRSTNTDVEGFLANLDAATPGWDRGLEFDGGAGAFAAEHDLDIGGGGFQFELKLGDFGAEEVEGYQRENGDAEAACGGDQGFANPARDRHHRQFRISHV